MAIDSTPTITKTWNVTSGNPRASHAEMDGETVPFKEPFSNGLMYPGDASGDVDETAGCTCVMSVEGTVVGQGPVIKETEKYVRANLGVGTKPDYQIVFKKVGLDKLEVTDLKLADPDVARMLAKATVEEYKTNGIDLEILNHEALPAYKRAWVDAWREEFAVKTESEAITSVDQLEFNAENAARAHELANDPHVRLGYTREELEQHLEKLFDIEGREVRMASRVPDEALQSILDDGRFKTQFETSISRGNFDPGLRAQTEERLFGYGADLPVEQRPFYGYLTDAAGGPGDAVDWYGKTEIVFKKDILSRTTWSAGDSLSRDLVVSGVEDPSLDGLLQLRRIPDPELDSWNMGSIAEPSHEGFLEAQAHGGLTMDDVQEIRLYSPTREMSDLLEKYGWKADSAASSSDYVTFTRAETSTTPFADAPLTAEPSAAGSEANQVMKQYFDGSDLNLGRSGTKIQNIDNLSARLLEDTTAGFQDELAQLGQRLKSRATRYLDRAGVTNAMTDEETGARYLAMSFQDTWATSSTDANPLSLGMQRAVANEFGFDNALEGTSTLSEPSPANATMNLLFGTESNFSDTIAYHMSIVENSELTKGYIRATYSETQEILANAGVSEITLFRGIFAVGGSDFQFAAVNGGPLEIGLNPLSSFSTELHVAADFTPSSSPVVMRTTIPVSRVFSTATSGPGCLNEYEFLVIGGPTDNEVFIFSRAEIQDKF